MNDASCNDSKASNDDKSGADRESEGEVSRSIGGSLNPSPQEAMCISAVVALGRVVLVSVEIYKDTRGTRVLERSSRDAERR